MAHEFDTEGTLHVHASLLHAEQDETICALRLQVWPLPDDDELHQQLAKAFFRSVDRVMRKHGFQIGQWQEGLPPEGPTQ